MPVLLLVMLAIGAVLWFVFSRVGLGRQILAVGANPRAAELAGVPVNRSRIVVHALAGFLAAFAGIILTARLGVAQPSIGNDWLLSSFAAPIIGGTLLSGGYLSVPGVIAGALLLTLVANGLIQLNIDPYWTQLFSGPDDPRRRRHRPAADAQHPAPGARRALCLRQSRPGGATTGTADAVERPGGPPADGRIVLELTEVSKGFPGVQALDRVSLTLRQGEVQALLGENGAGKSTLIKIITGVYRADEGAYRIDGKDAHIASPRQAFAHGIGVVHQERSLVPTFTAGENVLLERIVGHAFQLIDREQIHRDARPYMEMVGLNIEPSHRVESLSPAQKQLIEIARALSLNTRILLLDEPTASISLNEADTLLKTINRLKAQGVSILYVTHKLEEVFQICDSVTVLRDGKNAAPTSPIAELNRDQLIARMIGRSQTNAPLPVRGAEGANPCWRSTGLQSANSPIPARFSLATRAKSSAGTAWSAPGGRNSHAR